MELKDLVGIHLLDGVDYGTEKYDWDEEPTDAGYLRFRLDGVTYLALEDPNDGYCSSMRELKVDSRAPSYTFPPALVEGRYVDKESAYYSGGEEYTQNILELYDVLTGELVLRVGTHTDDYYPSFVSSWKPEGLAINQHLKVEDK